MLRGATWRLARGLAFLGSGSWRAGRRRRSGRTPGYYPAYASPPSWSTRWGGWGPPALWRWSAWRPRSTASSTLSPAPLARACSPASLRRWLTASTASWSAAGVRCPRRRRVVVPLTSCGARPLSSRRGLARLARTVTTLPAVRLSSMCRRPYAASPLLRPGVLPAGAPRPGAMPFAAPAGAQVRSPTCARSAPPCSRLPPQVRRPGAWLPARSAAAAAPPPQPRGPALSGLRARVALDRRWLPVALSLPPLTPPPSPPLTLPPSPARLAVVLRPTPPHRLRRRI